MSMEDHPLFSHLPPEERREAIVRVIGNRIIPHPDGDYAGDDGLIYIDKDGLYGDATGLFILLESDLGREGMAEFEKAKDSAMNLLEWILGHTRERGILTDVHQITASGRLYTGRAGGPKKRPPWLSRLKRRR